MNEILETHCKYCSTQTPDYVNDCINSECTDPERKEFDREVAWYINCRCFRCNECYDIHIE